MEKFKSLKDCTSPEEVRDNLIDVLQYYIECVKRPLGNDEPGVYNLSEKLKIQADYIRFYMNKVDNRLNELNNNNL